MNNYIIMQTTKQTREQTTNVTTNITNHPQATKSNHSPLSWRGAGGEAVGGEASLYKDTKYSAEYSAAILDKQPNAANELLK